MKGKTCLVTGANAGIGLETARALARQGATVVMAARNRAKGEAALEDVRHSTGNRSTELLMLDLASTDSIREAAEVFKAGHDRLDVLINNAGLVYTGDETTQEGFDMMFGVNHLGHFLLTHLLLDVIKASAPARIINVASMAHLQSRGLDYEALRRGGPGSAFSGYGDSKLANILYTRELARRLEGTGVTANSLHPGVVATDFGAADDTNRFFGFLVKLAAPFMKTRVQGARTSIYLATSPEVEGVTGRYFSDCKEAKASRFATDDEAAAKLWALSIEMLGVEG